MDYLYTNVGTVVVSFIYQGVQNCQMFNLKTVRGDIMTKAELIEKMAKDAGITKASAGKAYESFLDGLEGKFPMAFPRGWRSY
jgi:hypothetical protein